MIAAGVVLAAAAAGAGVFGPPLSEWLPFSGDGDRPDLLTHTVQLERLPVTVVERGTLESAENMDVLCRVKAGSRGTYSSTIRWVIEDGSMVNEGQLLMELDDSALQDQFRTQVIAVDKARAEWVTADENYVITVKQNESDIALATAALQVAELDVEKYVGLRLDATRVPLGGIVGASGVLTERGEYRQLLDDVSGRLKLAESDLEAYRDRSAWASRSVALGYMTPSQAKVEEAKLAGALDNVEKLRTERYILETFLRKRNITDLVSKHEVADLDLERAVRQARAKEAQAESTRKTAYSVYQQEEETLRDVENQIRQCKIYAPQTGLAVYHKSQTSRYSSNQSMIAVGEQVKEGQKLMRIPDLRKMQVNTKVHEAIVPRVRGDDRKSTGFCDAVRVGLMAGPHAFTRILDTATQPLAIIQEKYRDKEYYMASRGQRASIRVDSFPNSKLQGHVKSVAAVSSQADYFNSDVKVYETIVTIDESLGGLKPDMNCEVTIHIDESETPVLAVPLQAVVGSADTVAARGVYVMTPTGPARRDVKLGAFNEKMIEVIEGLQEGDVVVLNPAAVSGEPTAKPTADAIPEGKGGPGKGADGGDKRAGGKKGGKGPPA